MHISALRVTPTLKHAGMVGQVVPVLDPYLSPLTTIPAALPMPEGEQCHRCAILLYMFMCCSCMRSWDVVCGRCSKQVLKPLVCTHVSDGSGGADGAGQEKYTSGRDVVKAESPEESAQAHYKAVTAAAAAAARHEQGLRMQVAKIPLRYK